MVFPFDTPVLVLLAFLWVACDGANAQKDQLTSLNPTLCSSSDIFLVSNLSIVYHRWTHTLDYAITATALRGGMSPSGSVQASAYGKQAPDQMISLCDYKFDCPFTVNVPQTRYGSQMIYNDTYTGGIPTLVWTFPDLDATATFLFYNNDTRVACVRTEVSNGITAQKAAVHWGTAAATIGAVIVSGIAGIAGAFASTPFPTGHAPISGGEVEAGASHVSNPGMTGIGQAAPVVHTGGETIPIGHIDPGGVISSGPPGGTVPVAGGVVKVTYDPSGHIIPSGAGEPLQIQDPGTLGTGQVIGIHSGGPPDGSSIPIAQEGPGATAGTGPPGGTLGTGHEVPGADPAGFPHGPSVVSIYDPGAQIPIGGGGAEGPNTLGIGHIAHDMPTGGAAAGSTIHTGHLGHGAEIGSGPAAGTLGTSNEIPLADPAGFHAPAAPHLGWDGAGPQPDTQVIQGPVHDGSALVNVLAPQDRTAPPVQPIPSGARPPIFSTNQTPLGADSAGIQGTASLGTAPTTVAGTQAASLLGAGHIAGIPHTGADPAAYQDRANFAVNGAPAGAHVEFDPFSLIAAEMVLAAAPPGKKDKTHKPRIAMAGPPAPRMESITLFLHFQSISTSGLLSLNYPPLYRAFTLNFAWANFLLPITAFRRRAQRMRLCDLPTPASRAPPSGIPAVENTAPPADFSYGIPAYAAKLNISQQDVFTVAFFLYLCLAGLLLLVYLVAGVTIQIARRQATTEERQQLWSGRAVRLQQSISNNTLRLMVVGLGTFTVVGLYQLTLQCISPPTAFFVALMLILTIGPIMFATFLIIRLGLREGGTEQLYVEDGSYARRLGALYLQLDQSRVLFTALVFALVLIRGAAVGLGQRNGLVQTIVFIALEVALCVVLFYYKPYASPGLNRVHYLLEVTRAATYIMLLLFAKNLNLGPIAPTALAVLLVGINSLVSLALIIITIIKLGWGRLWKRPNRGNVAHPNLKPPARMSSLLNRWRAKPTGSELPINEVKIPSDEAKLVLEEVTLPETLFSFEATRPLSEATVLSVEATRPLSESTLPSVVPTRPLSDATRPLSEATLISAETTLSLSEATRSLGDAKLTSADAQ